MEQMKKDEDGGIVQLSHRPIDYPNLSDKKRKELQQELVSVLNPFFETLKDHDPS